MNVPFDSNAEREIAINLYYQYKLSLIEGKTCHIGIGRCEYDFLINKSFIEYHPFNLLFDKCNLENYYKKRRKNLDKNGYKGYPLIIIR